MKNKLIILSLSCLICLFLYIRIDFKKHEYIVDNMFINDINYNDSKYIGYILIPELNIKREIVLGINDNNLKEHIAINSNDVDDNLILAGHSVYNVFINLHKANVGQIIYLNINGKMYVYEITGMDRVLKTKKYKFVSDLSLITCINNNYRLIIKAKKND